jgi:hypothetical protein
LPHTDPPHSIRLPLLHIRLSVKESSLRTIGLVDSGSTSTFIPLEIAEMLSMPIEKEESAVGAGGKFQNTIRRVDITILKGFYPVAKFSNFPAYVPTELDRIPYVVLGRDSIFRKFDIVFREKMQRVLLKAPKIMK